MKFYCRIMIVGCWLNAALAAHTSCGLTHWQYRPTAFTIADHGQAYYVQLQTIKCHDTRTGEVELVYSSQPIQHISRPEYIEAQNRYHLMGGQMGLQGDIVMDTLNLPVTVQNQSLSTSIGQLKIKVCFSRAALPTPSSTFVNASQVFGTSTRQPVTIELNT